MSSIEAFNRNTVSVAVAGVIGLILLLSSCSGSPEQPQSQPKGPVIYYLNAPRQVTPSGEAEITCVAADSSDDKLAYSWTISTGQVKSQKLPDVMLWKASEAIGSGTISVTVSNSRGEKTTRSVNIEVTMQITSYPEISRLLCTSCPAGDVSRNSQYSLKCEARDPGGNALRYVWIASIGRIKPGDIVPGAAYAEWYTGTQYGSALITVKVINSSGREAEAYLALPINCCK